MPRKSRAELATISNIQDHRPRITAPPGMSPEELTVFQRIVAQSHPTHFTESDGPLLQAYCQAIVLTGMAFDTAMQRPAELPTWERCVKTMATLATKLRLCPHSRSDPKTVMRAISGQSRYETGGVSLEALASIRDGGSRGWTCRG